MTGWTVVGSSCVNAARRADAPNAKLLGGDELGRTMAEAGGSTETSWADPGRDGTGFADEGWTIACGGGSTAGFCADGASSASRAAGVTGAGAAFAIGAATGLAIGAATGLAIGAATGLAIGATGLAIGVTAGSTPLASMATGGVDSGVDGVASGGVEARFCAARIGAAAGGGV